MSNQAKILKLAIDGVNLRVDDHVYELPDGTELEMSVTSIVEKQFRPFEKEKIARILTAPGYKYEDLDQEELIERWEDMRNHGTLVHEQIATWIQSKMEPTEAKAILARDWHEENFYAEHFQSFPELKVYDQDIGIAGTIDLLVVDLRNDECRIIDWKTAGKIDSSRDKGITEECTTLRGKMGQYSLQLAFYSYLLKTHGIHVSRQHLGHLTEDALNLIEVEDHFDIVQQIIDNQIR